MAARMDWRGISVGGALGFIGAGAFVVFPDPMFGWFILSAGVGVLASALTMGVLRDNIARLIGVIFFVAALLIGWLFEDEITDSRPGPKLTVTSIGLAHGSDGYRVIPKLENMTDIDVHSFAYAVGVGVVPTPNDINNDQAISYMSSSIDLVQKADMSSGSSFAMSRGIRFPITANPVPDNLMQSDEHKYLLVFAAYAPEAKPHRVWVTAYCVELTQLFTPAALRITTFTTCPVLNGYFSARHWDLARKAKDVLGISKR